MTEYTVKVHSNGDKHWYLNGELHAIEYADGYKMWYLDGKRVSEKEHKRRTRPKN